MADAAEAFLFGPFRLVPARRALFADGHEVSVRSRAFDLLVTLVERRERVVPKDELMELVWPGRVVEEGNVTVHIASLRKLLGKGVIATLPGRGYRFIAPVEKAATIERAPTTPEQASDAPAPPEGGPSAAYETAFLPHPIPRPLTRLVGRTRDVDRVEDLLGTSRLVTVVGAGGIGKTRLALAIAVADPIRRRFPDGVWLADLGPLDDTGRVPATIASALGVEIRDGEVLRGITLFLSTRRGLLVVDGCEHLIGGVAVVVEAILRACPDVAILATSREPLRAEGESLHRLRPLGMAPADAAITANQLDEYPASELFVERARAVLEDFAPSDSEAREVMEICRRLDGIPLAIELAVPRLEALVLAELRDRLDRRFGLLTAGRRTALPRQQTLRATIGWSYDLLSEPERMVLRRVAIFAGPFTLEAAGVVAASPKLASTDAIEELLSLVAKSLVVAAGAGAFARYRLLDTTRAYALEKLGESGELEAVARGHAEYFRDLLERAESEWDSHPAAEWVAQYGRQIDNLRAALDWTFSPGGDASIGVGLTLAAVPLWTLLSLMEEWRRYVEQALANLEAIENPDKRSKMQLSAALGAALMYTNATPATKAAFTQALEIADCLDDADYRFRALWGLWVDQMNGGALDESLSLAERLSHLASCSADPIALAIGHRTMAFSLHFFGEQAKSRHHFEQMFNGYVPAPGDRPILRFQFDPWLTAQMRLGVVLWLQGHPDQAIRKVESCLDDALSVNHSVTLCNGLASGACPVALLNGDLDAAERWVAISLENAKRSGLTIWQDDAHCLEGVLFIRRGDIARGLSMLARTLEKISSATLHTRYDMFFAELADAFGQVGDTAAGLSVLESALDRTERTKSQWYVAEFLRIKGELILREKASGAESAAETIFRQSSDLAGHQGALSWELRTAMSLARLYGQQGRITRACEVLECIYARFTEGFATADLTASKALLASLR